jgi:hypothetical protein
MEERKDQEEGATLLLEIQISFLYYIYSKLFHWLKRSENPALFSSNSEFHKRRKIVA